jgi:catechol 2,3-dioxygenase-like lactoylglutathione lyase family enzyme
MNLNQVTIGSTDLTRSEHFYTSLGLRPIVRDRHYLRFECPRGESTFSVELVEVPPADTALTIYFETDRIDADYVRLVEAGVVSTRNRPTCRGCGGRLGFATPMAIGCAFTTPGSTARIRRGGSSDEGS